jgi:hypothetical protein
MGELSLLPAVRGAGDDTLIVADGTSCRHQIADGTRHTGKREAMHAIRVLAAAVQRAPRPTHDAEPRNAFGVPTSGLR